MKVKLICVDLLAGYYLGAFVGGARANTKSSNREKNTTLKTFFLVAGSTGAAIVYLSKICKLSNPKLPIVCSVVSEALQRPNSTL